MIHGNYPDFGKPSVEIGPDFSTICLDKNLYDLENAKKFLSGFSEIKCLSDDENLVIFIEDKDAKLLRENTLNLCNLLFEKCFRVR